MWKGDGMTRIIFFLILAANVSVPTISRAETGPCQESNLEKKVTCLNKRLGDAESLLKGLQSLLGTSPGSAVKRGDSVVLTSEWSSAYCVMGVSENSGVLLRPCGADGNRFARFKVGN